MSTSLENPYSARDLSTSLLRLKIPELTQLSPKQLRGLREVNFYWVSYIEPKSLRQQVAEAPPDYFGDVNPSEILQTIVPGFYQGAINPDLNGDNNPVLPKSNYSSLDDQLQMVYDFNRAIRKKRIKGTLQGVEFVIEEASVYTQPGIAKLLIAKFVQSISPTNEDGSFADVGRLPDSDNLCVFENRRNDIGMRSRWALPVARPIQKK